MPMTIQNKLRCTVLLVSIFISASGVAQSILPPVIEWKGKSESLIVAPGHRWITPAEKSGFVRTPDHTETLKWFKELSDASPVINVTSIGKSPEGRDILMVIASLDRAISPEALRSSGKPVLLVQAGIHAGEIDGKDAGMMLLRDIAFGDKRDLLQKVTLLFIPILNVDGHERSSPYNRPNQRGPENMGWRTNAQNLNLNRDYTKQDTKEIRAVTNVMNQYDPIMYMDIHVTDGADYQYDITFGGHGKQGYSPEISDWLRSTFKPTADKDLIAYGHIPGPLLFAVNDRDFSQGNLLALGEPRFSDSYGDVRHMASVLVENHSLKPFKQRVLGTYVLLESTIKLLASEGETLKQRTKSDRERRLPKLPMKFKVPQMQNAVSFETQGGLKRSAKAAPPDSMILLGIESKILKSPVTHSDYVEWTGKPVTMKIAAYKSTEPTEWLTRPKGYWVPASCFEIIERLRRHGITMEVIKQPKEVNVEMYRIQDARFQDAAGKPMPFEGHMQVTGKTVTEMRKQLFPVGSVYVSTDQVLGDLAILLLEPRSPDSYFSWGFFPEIFQRTEYIEAYVMQPTMKKMLDESPALKKEFEHKMASDAVFAKDPDAIFTWFYSKTKYFDDRYLLYPVAREM